MAAATVQNSKQVTVDVAPHLTARALTALLAIAVEELTIEQLTQLCDALTRCGGGSDPARTIGSLLP